MQGYWAPYDGRYVWYPGRWVQPPYGGGEWRPAWLEHGEHGYRYHEGYWARHRDRDDDDDDHHGNGHAYGHYKHGHDRD